MIESDKIKLDKTIQLLNLSVQPNKLTNDQIIELASDCLQNGLLAAFIHWEGVMREKQITIPNSHPLLQSIALLHTKDETSRAKGKLALVTLYQSGNDDAGSWYGYFLYRRYIYDKQEGKGLEILQAMAQKSNANANFFLFVIKPSWQLLFSSAQKGHIVAIRYILANIRHLPIHLVAEWALQVEKLDQIDIIDSRGQISLMSGKLQDALSHYQKVKHAKNPCFFSIQDQIRSIKQDASYIEALILLTGGDWSLIGSYHVALNLLTIKGPPYPKYAWIPTPSYVVLRPILDKNTPVKTITAQPKKGIQLLRESAKKGNYKAAFLLAICHQIGLGVEQNEKLAFKQIQALAKKGFPWAENTLGVYHGLGIGTKVNSELSTFWYQKASSSGILVATMNLGVNMINGEGVDKNITKGIELCRQAANDGLSAAYGALAYGMMRNMYEDVKYYDTIKKMVSSSSINPSDQEIAMAINQGSHAFMLFWSYVNYHNKRVLNAYIWYEIAKNTPKYYSDQQYVGYFDKVFEIENINLSDDKLSEQDKQKAKKAIDRCRQRDWLGCAEKGALV